MTWAVASASSVALLGLLRFSGFANVGLKEEMAKEHKVAEVHDGTPKDVGNIRVALALLHPGEDQVVDNTAHKHLRDLWQRDEHGKLARHSEARSPQGIVSVHDSMHNIVHGHEPATTGYHVLVGIPRVKQYSNVVVPVEEDELLFPKNNKYCIS